MNDEEDNPLIKKEWTATITIRQRKDGGLRVYSDNVPGLVLSHSDSAAVLADIGPALGEILGICGYKVT